MDDHEFFRIIQNICQKQNDSNKNLLKKDTENFDEQLKKIIDSDDGRHKLIHEVECQKAIDFEQIFDETEFNERRFSYIGSGSFGNAIILQYGRRRSPRIIKAIRCLPYDLAKNFNSGVMSYLDVHKELMCLKTLFKLCRGVRITHDQMTLEGSFDGDNSSDINQDDDNDQGQDARRQPQIRQQRFRFQTNCFPRLYKSYLCRNESKAKYNFETMYPMDYNRPMHKNLETAIFVMEHCGKQLNDLIDDCEITPLSIISVIKQLILGLAIAENIFKFEHRDLHLSNITCIKTKNKWIKFVYKSKNYQIYSMGFETKIIDFSYSRIQNHDQRIYFKDLSFLNNPNWNKSNNNINNSSSDDDTKSGPFAGPYDEMASFFKPNQWHKYSSQSNITWIKYSIKSLLNLMQSAYPDSFYEENLIAFNYLEKLYEVICKQCDDLFQLFNHLISDEFNTIVPFK